MATNPYPKENCTEYLVTLVGKHILVNDTTIVQFDDPGKASLITNINVGEKSVLIANIHCPFGNARNVAFNKLIGEIGTSPFIIVGDLNSETWELKKMLAPNTYNFSNITKPTRITKIIKKTKKGDQIVLKESTLDHMIGSKDNTFNQIFVGPNNNLSDHLLIGAIVQLK